MPHKITINRGSYLVIDPCYAFPREAYCDLIDRYENLGEKPLEVLGMGDFDIILIHCREGDGNYPVLESDIQVGKSVVDSGMLCLIPQHAVDKHQIPEHLGTWAKVENTSRVRYARGHLRAGNVEVIT